MDALASTSPNLEPLPVPKFQSSQPPLRLHWTDALRFVPPSLEPLPKPEFKSFPIPETLPVLEFEPFSVPFEDFPILQSPTKMGVTTMKTTSELGG
ncbi:hypothetical protein BDN67DRAFT_573896 [Paxillus ammoniavirescens]|nr:hypothetical protein BDN67DRAFT_573896 [Paxillus ammoniavirescens]